MFACDVNGQNAGGFYYSGTMMERTECRLRENMHSGFWFSVLVCTALEPTSTRSSRHSYVVRAIEFIM